MIYVRVFGVTVNLFAQIAGLAGLVLIVWAYQLRKKGFLILSTAAMLFFLAESCILYADADTFTGIVLNAAAIVRNLLMLLFLCRFRREMPPWAAVCLLLPVWAVCAFHVSAWYTWLPPLLQTVYTFCALSKNYFVLKGGAFVLESGNLFYHAAVGAYVGIVRQIMLVTSVVAGTIVLAVRQARAKKTARGGAGKQQPPRCRSEEESEESPAP